MTSSSSYFETARLLTQPGGFALIGRLSPGYNFLMIERTHPIT
ncbi:hypothetical protein BH23BAC4_BH23BAC4_14730 [soil metagenome]